MSSKRIRDFGITIGELPTGSRNAITDVPGVKVGHCTIDTPEHQTGVTVVIPASHNLFAKKLPAASFVCNGFGKTLGLIQVDELGSLETPIALTNTLNVGLVHDAIVEYTVRRCEKDGVEVHSLNPVVCECNDAELNHITERVVSMEHVLSAIETASEDFEQGAVGAGRGTVCYGFKGGIGSSSRRIALDGQTYTVGVLVQSNHGRTADLTIAGSPVGKNILSHSEASIGSSVKFSPAASVGSPDSPFAAPVIQPANLDRGSIIMIVGTDLPVSDRQLKRILKRAAVGLIRTGSYLGHGSGDIMVGFSTAYTLPSTEDNAVISVPLLNENRIEQAFRAAAEACEEAILNSLAAADTVNGVEGHIRQGLSSFLGSFAESPL